MVGGDCFAQTCGPGHCIEFESWKEPTHPDAQRQHYQHENGRGDLFDVTDVSVFHSAQATFFAPSNPSGVHGMYRETIRSTPRWTRGEIPGPRRDCVFVSAPGDETDTTVNDLNVARVLSFFSFSRSGKVYQCALVHWFST